VQSCGAVSRYNKTDMTDIQNKRGDIFFESDKVIILIILKTKSCSIILYRHMGNLWNAIDFIDLVVTILLWSGLFIGIANFVVFIFTLFRSNKSEVLFGEIKSIKVKKI
jgi:hypothetical protein